MRTLTNILTEGLSILMMICSFSSYGQIPGDYVDEYEYGGTPAGTLGLYIVMFVAVLIVFIGSIFFNQWIDDRDSEKRKAELEAKRNGESNSEL